MGDETNGLFGSRITITIVAILTNVTALVVVFTSTSLHTNGFIRNILSLCVSDLITATFVIPISLIYHGNANINYGSEVCNAWLRLAYCNRALSCFILVTMCIFCLVSKLHNNGRIRLRVYKIIEMVLVISPWFLVLIAYVPLFLTESNNTNSGANFADQLCLFTNTNYNFSVSIIFLVLPPSLLLLTIVVMHIMYKVMQRKHSQDPDQETEADGRLRMFTVGTWLVSLMTICCWIPFIIVMLLLLFCRTSTSSVSQCYPSLHAIDTTYTISLVPSTLTPFCWLFISEFRVKLLSIMSHVTQTCTCGQSVDCTKCSCQKPTTEDDINALTMY
ncbi:histamine H1 receptor-like isoform X2 [Pecten maximus]|nr:histamine H1 receptor-like isoform X2 [Pecten maximus]